ncbi:hypothetical protein VHEMI02696 [[Torrubiella] hemipterigena]|uniref:Uncharacterized protein n=1 Tax=[Torrubiella] hemipterigena TaxID=1531966 RepID=A0A0A1T8R9_9HYPO|nr:hypothetical protein VHEMI02696 [[Torrubiella] hemipterigena]
MRILSALAVILLAGASRAAGEDATKPSQASSPQDAAWPKETKGASQQKPANIREYSPRPTEGPKAVFGRMELNARLEGYTLDAGVCGYQADSSSFGRQVGCYNPVWTCSYRPDGFAGCCPPGQDCSAINTACVEGTAAKSCGPDSQTLCCVESASNKCFTWDVGITGVGGKATKRYTLYDCAPTAGSRTLVDYDPVWSKTHFSMTGNPTIAPTTSPDSGGGSSTNIGAIVGGAVGGLAALTILTVGICCFRRRRTRGAASTATKSEFGAQGTRQIHLQQPQRYHAVPQRLTFNTSPFGDSGQTSQGPVPVRKDISPLASQHSLSSHGTPNYTNTNRYESLTYGPTHTSTVSHTRYESLGQTTMTSTSTANHNRYGSVGQASTSTTAGPSTSAHISASAPAPSVASSDHQPTPSDIPPTPPPKRPMFARLAELPDHQVGSESNRAELS